jgi:hypothetical protein
VQVVDVSSQETEVAVHVRNTSEIRGGPSFEIKVKQLQERQRGKVDLTLFRCVYEQSLYVLSRSSVFK